MCWVSWKGARLCSGWVGEGGPASSDSGAVLVLLRPSQETPAVLLCQRKPQLKGSWALCPRPRVPQPRAQAREGWRLSAPAAGEAWRLPAPAGLLSRQDSPSELYIQGGLYMGGNPSNGLAPKTCLLSSVKTGGHCRLFQLWIPPGATRQSSLLRAHQKRVRVESAENAGPTAGGKACRARKWASSRPCSPEGRSAQAHPGILCSWRSPALPAAPGRRAAPT